MGKILEIEFEDEELLECVEIFNEIAETQYPEILSFNHMDLYTASYRRISPTTWKKFLLNEKVLEWYEQERAIAINSKVNNMINSLDKHNSTAQVQGLNTLLNQINKDTEKAESNEIFIYNFIPLTEEEEKNPNVNIAKNVPNQIRNAIQSIHRANPNKK